MEWCDTRWIETIVGTSVFRFIVFFILNLRCAQITNKRQGACAYYSVVQSESVFSKMFRKIMSIPHSCAFRHLSICGLSAGTGPAPADMPRLCRLAAQAGEMNRQDRFPSEAVEQCPLRRNIRLLPDRACWRFRWRAVPGVWQDRVDRLDSLLFAC